MIGLSRSVSLSGGSPAVASMGRGRQQGTWRFYRAKAVKLESIPFVYASFFDAPILTHLISLCSICFVVLRVAPKKSIVVFYNPLPFYLLTILFCRLLGRRCILDFEDGLRSDVSVWRRLTHKLLLRTFETLSEGTILVSTQLRRQIRKEPYLVCYGVSRQQDPVRDWSKLPIQILFSGSLYKDTGADLFLEALRLLKRNCSTALSSLRFVSAGFGPAASEIERAANSDLKDHLVFLGKISNGEYRELLKNSHVGLCLKLPDYSMGSTTFPSKVVEIASSGLLLISTRVSDIPLLFGEQDAVILNSADPDELSQKAYSDCISPGRVS